MPRMQPVAAIAEPVTQPALLTQLSELRPGQQARIVAVQASDSQRRRLLEMGLTADTIITCVRRAPLGDPTEYQLRGYSLVLRKAQTAAIQVTLGQDGAASQASQDGAAPESPATPSALLAGSTHSASRFALIGNPNCGKSALFNVLTGLRQKVANYAGVTVEKKTGRCQVGERSYELIDLPGTYSLSPTSPDERVACQVVLGERADTPSPEALLVVLDSTCLTRHLYLVSQIMDLGLTCVVALAKSDIARRRGMRVDHQALEQYLGVPVVPVCAISGEGVEQLKQALHAPRVLSGRPWKAQAALQAATQQLAHELAHLLPHLSQPAQHVAAERLLTGADSLLRWRDHGDERLVAALAKVRHSLEQQGIDALCADVEARYQWVDQISAQVVGSHAPSDERSDRIDRIMLHPASGLGIFALVMSALFYVVFAVADPLMTLAEDGVTALGATIGGLLGPGLLHDLWMDGVVAGVGGVMVFVPQIALLFGLLAILEETGYLARAAFLMDRLLSAVGLHGKSFIPLLSAHACAIPGIMSARAIESQADRLVTMLVAPFMSCTARLPVYVLLIGLFFGERSAGFQAGIMASLYFGGIVAAAATAWLARRTVLARAADQFLVEFPVYSLPQWQTVVRAMAVNAWAFVRRAGTIILTFSILLWAALRWPGLPEDRIAALMTSHAVSAEQVEQVDTAEDPEALPTELVAQVTAFHNAVDGTQIANSAAGRLGHVLEPLIAPLGFDWKIGIGLIGAFAAREVFVSTMGITYAVGGDDENTDPLAAAMASDTRDNGSALWTLPVGLALLVWFVIAMQCISTVAVMRRETLSWRWPLMQLGYMNALAWVAALVTYHLTGALV